MEYNEVEARLPRIDIAEEQEPDNLLSFLTIEVKAIKDFQGQADLRYYICLTDQENLV